MLERGEGSDLPTEIPPGQAMRQLEDDQPRERESALKSRSRKHTWNCKHAEVTVERLQQQIQETV